MDYKNYLIDRVRRLYFKNKSTGAVIWAISQPQEIALNATMETQEITDALDTVIAELGKSKGLEISGQNAIFDFGLLAAQFGDEVTTSGSEVTFAAPAVDELILDDNGKATTLYVPNGTGAAGIPYVYSVNTDGSLKEKFPYAAAASSTEFTWALENNVCVITAPTGFVAGEKIIVLYEYTADAGNVVDKTVDLGEVFPSSGELWMEVLFRNVCDKEVKYHGFVKFTNAQLDGNFDLNLTPDGKHPFTIRAMQNYCDTTKELCTFYIPAEAPAAKPVPAKYTITYNGNGGTASAESGETGYDGKLAEMPTATYADHEFTKWTIAQDGTGDAVTTATIFTANTTIYAQWTTQ